MDIAVTASGATASVPGTLKWRLPLLRLLEPGFRGLVPTEAQRVGCEPQTAEPGKGRMRDRAEPQSAEPGRRDMR